ILVKSFPPAGAPPKRWYLEFELRIDADAPAFLSPIALGGVFMGTTIDDGGVFFAIGTDGLYVTTLGPADAGAKYDQTKASAVPALGSWDGRFGLEVTFGGDGGDAGGCIQAYAGGQKLLGTCMPLPAALAAHSSQASIVLGVYAAGFGSIGHSALSV